MKSWGARKWTVNLSSTRGMCIPLDLTATDESDKIWGTDETVSEFIDQVDIYVDMFIGLGLG